MSGKARRFEIAYLSVFVAYENKPKLEMCKVSTDLAYIESYSHRFDKITIEKFDCSSKFVDILQYIQQILNHIVLIKSFMDYIEGITNLIIGLME